MSDYCIRMEIGHVRQLLDHMRSRDDGSDMSAYWCGYIQEKIKRHELEMQNSRTGAEQ